MASPALYLRLRRRELPWPRLIWVRRLNHPRTQRVMSCPPARSVSLANMWSRPLAPVVLSATAMGATWPNVTAAEAPRFADRLEAWGAALSFGAFKLLPRDYASALGGALARRIGPSLGVSRYARRNISRAFPESEIARVVAGMWDNLGR